MTKSELIELIASRQSQLSAKDVELAVKTIIEHMSQTLSAGDRIESTIGDALAGHDPAAVVPAHAWQCAEPLGDVALVGCTVTPGFEFEGFELAPPDWSPEE